MFSGSGPSEASFSPVVIEDATVCDVNKNNYTVSVVTQHTSKRFDDIQCGLPYFHNKNGEGIYFLPEVGAVCKLCRSSDTTPPFIMCFIAVPSVRESTDGTPTRSTPAGGSTTDVSFKGKRLDLQPGDMALATRDENFVILRRGGVLQIGSTDLAQRIYIPINNFIHDVCENYTMDTLGGALRWNVERVENDPGGNAPISYVLALNEFAQDEKASIMVRHMPPGTTEGDSKNAWEVVVAKNKIDRQTGDYTDETYVMQVEFGGKKTEVTADYEIHAKGKFTLVSDQDMELKSSRKALLQGASEARVKAAQVILEGTVLAGGADANEPGVLGNQLITYLATIAAALNGIASGSVQPPTPALLSSKVKLST